LEKAIKYRTAAETPPVQGSGGPGHELRHMVAPWTTGSSALWVGETTLQPGVSTQPSAIEGAESAHVTLEGTGLEIVEGEHIETAAGSYVFIPLGALHQVVNTGTTPLKLVTISTPPPVKRPPGAEHDSA
jgi:mannose-6-phosphate isomerase-like protein (cupin superfamily)